MPYNTTAIPPRKEVTGQTQLPLSRVKKIVAQDPDVNMCSNNAAFILTLAAELFIQHLAEQSQTQAKLDRKPRRNIQYKDVASAVSHHDHLEFLEDMVPKTVPLKKARTQAAATQAKLRGETAPGALPPPGTEAAAAAGAASSTSVRPGTAGSAVETIVNHEGVPVNALNETVRGANSSDFHLVSRNGRPPPPPQPPGRKTTEPAEDPSEQLELEMRQAAGSRDGDVQMTG